MKYLRCVIDPNSIAIGSESLPATCERLRLIPTAPSFDPKGVACPFITRWNISLCLEVKYSVSSLLAALGK
jgi:hypothetical protein